MFFFGSVFRFAVVRLSVEIISLKIIRISFSFFNLKVYSSFPASSLISLQVRNQHARVIDDLGRKIMNTKPAAITVNALGCSYVLIFLSLSLSISGWYWITHLKRANERKMNFSFGGITA